MKVTIFFVLFPFARSFSPTLAGQGRSGKDTKLAISVDPISVDPMVAAAAGMAIVAGGASVVISSKLREMDGEEGSAPAAAPAAAPPLGSDISIPYDAAAKLAYDKAGSPGDYDSFKAKYEADAVADVIAKKK